ncbi:MAG: chromosome segregation protein SMC [Eubacteriales bacterium]|nr:chromosome segregation protein SMC [Eubacteriales bacterium]MDD3350088.1 chromosome segregation protein SMC [Eubacteriales bacterium]
MYFKKIDIQGFKSFAEPVSIEFHGGITCIVGPNGSGKSNISDAIRWVLGEQSPKMLRGGKMEEVIFAGTANRKSRGMAEVTLVIDNNSHILPIDYSEVAITRRMYRSGESEYLINKVPCRLRDIRELIMDTGIGVDGYSIIGQGKIAEIVSNKPESRREIFEEAAGIVKYRTKKEEAERKLTASRGNLDRVDDIVSEIEGRIGSLRDDSIRATEYLELKDRGKGIEIGIVLKNVETIELKNEYIKDDLMELSNQIEEFKTDKESVDKDVSDNRARNEELEILGSETRDRLLVLIEEINLLSGQSQLRGEKLANIEKDKERIASELEGLSQKREREEENVAELSITKDKIDAELLLLQTDLITKTKTFERLSVEAEAAAKAVDDNKDKIYELHRFVAAKTGEINSLKNLESTLAKRKEQVLGEKELSETADTVEKEEFETAEAARDKATHDLEEMKKQKQFSEQEQLRLQSEELLSRKKVEELKLTIGDIAARRKMISEMESAYEGYNSGVRFIMKAGLSGLHGVVAELVTVPRGYETAIETALGAAVQNIVCNNEKNAQDAIAALKANKAGRLTFLPLTGIRGSRGSRDEGLKKADGFLGYAVDRVEYDEKYKNIMEYLLGRVVLVDYLEHAVKLSKNAAAGGLRFVTLEGEVVNAAGAITGGAFRSNTAGLLERKAEGEKLKERYLGFLREQEELTGRLAILSQKLEKNKTAHITMEAKYREAEMELLTWSKDIDRLSSRRSDSENSRAKLERELENIEQEENSAKMMAEKLGRALYDAQNGIEEAERLAEEAMLQSESAKKSIAEASEEITEARLRAGAKESERNNIDQLLSRIKSILHELEEEKQYKLNALALLDREKETLSIGDEGTAARLIQKEEEKADAEVQLSKITEEKLLVVRYLTEIQQKRESMEEVLLGYQTEKHELELKLAKNETQVESWKEKLWEEFELSYLQAIEFKKKDFNMNMAVKESREIKSRIKELGDINIGSIKEYESVKERYEFLTTQRADLLTAMESLIKIIEDMDRTIRKSFKESFDQIVVHFEATFQSLFGGGTAELRLEDENKPLETGIEIVAQPPGKKLQNINLMSGGEKTMTAIALMFAILKTKPTPFCILDEVEAALDDANIDRFAAYLRDFKEIQFALVTHQKATMEYADVLYGVTMPEQGISKIISLKLGDHFEL